MIDRILVNANIYTLNPGHPRATGLAIAGERIVAVGRDDEVKALATANTVIENLRGYPVLPGLVDAHIHWAWLSKARHAVHLHGVPSKAEALNRIKAYMEKLAPGDWLIGTGWSQDLWDDRSFPVKEDLDPITSHIPGMFRARSGHAAWVNSAALKIAGIDASTPDPPGGKIGRHADGTPNGMLFETAEDLVSCKIPSITPEKLAEWMKGTQEAAWKVGLTGIHDFDDPTCFMALQMLREQGELGIRVVKNINDTWIEHAHALGLRSGFGDNWLRIGGLKIFADGALGPRTAAMMAPFEGEPDNYGVVVTDKEEMYERVSRASKMGIPSTVHAIGDRAVHDVLDVYAAVRKEESESGIPRSARRHRIEHVQIIHPNDIHRLAELDVIASMQPIHTTSDWHIADRYWGERAKYSYNSRAQIDAGAKVAFGSDAPVEDFDPLKGIYAAVTRRDEEGNIPESGWYPENRLSIEEAIRGFTTGAAYAAGMENQAGILAPGYLADLIMPDHNLFGEPPEVILDTQIMGTMVGGEWRYRSLGT